MRLKRILSFLLAFVLAVGMNVADVSAAELEESILESGDLVVFDEDNRITFELPNPGDQKTFRIQIDHALYPNARIYVFPYGGQGDCTIRISGAAYTGTKTLNTKPAAGTIVFDTKTVFKIAGDGAEEYAVSVSTSEGNAAYALILTTEEDFVDMCGGKGNAVSIRKNQATEYGVSYFGGLRRLLAGDGEWFRYTADGDTYIHASAAEIDDLTIAVYDADTGLQKCITGADDRETVQEEYGQWTGYVSKKVELQPGHDYYFQVKSESAKKDSEYVYLFSAGLPRTVYDMIEVRSSKTFSIPANTTKTFSFEVSGYPKSSRLGGYGRICFQTGSVVNNLDITSLQITAPNGRVLTAPSQGQYNLSTPIDYDNYLTSRNNIPLNGTWKVSIRSKTALSGLYFRIKAQVDHIPGKDGNE